MTRVKFCGITGYDDALAAVEFGANALGFVFAPSPRRVESGAVREITERLPPFVTSVGVFVDESLEQIQAAVREARLDVVQLHGNAAYSAADIGARVLRRIVVLQDNDAVVRGPSPRTYAASNAAAALRERIREIGADTVLLDPGGGDGRAFDWSIARDLPVRVVLAGGLTVANVGQAIQIVQPYAVDVSSGIESSPGRKDSQKMQDFIAAVRSADARRTA